eukprot:TRINITY_DN2385_c0_g1_i1.p1 TRINITY_DN2385_c0_g1~~TRINITY_DN2385_c0_g1_i1.p1  ORF type:complete len:182 (+),score=10.21 TRINITY_DN2385_c0_g1_i1:1-546(+)
MLGQTASEALILERDELAKQLLEHAEARSEALTRIKELEEVAGAAHMLAENSSKQLEALLEETGASSSSEWETERDVFSHKLLEEKVARAAAESRVEDLLSQLLQERQQISALSEACNAAKSDAKEYEELADMAQALASESGEQIDALSAQLATSEARLQEVARLARILQAHPQRLQVTIG